MRIGHGYDAHRFCENKPLRMGGVTIDSPLGLLAHSDGDVVLHAVTDALLGAAAMGDIGKLFPDNDPKYKGADSLKLLRLVCVKLNCSGYKIGNVDATIIAQSPKLSPHINQMRLNLARVLDVGIDVVSVKATTEEGLGFSGEKLGIAAHAVCLIQKIEA